MGAWGMRVRCLHAASMLARVPPWFATSQLQGMGGTYSTLSPDTFCAALQVMRTVLQNLQHVRPVGVAISERPADGLPLDVLADVPHHHSGRMVREHGGHCCTGGGGGMEWRQWAWCSSWPRAATGCAGARADLPQLCGQGGECRAALWRAACGHMWLLAAQGLAEWVWPGSCEQAGFKGVAGCAPCLLHALP